MSVKIVIVFLCAAAGTATGYLILCGYRRRFEYYDGLCKLLNELSRNLEYRMDSAASVISRTALSGALLKKHAAEYAEYATGKTPELVLSRGFLRADELESVRGMFASLGASDGKTQANELKAQASAFCAVRDEAKQRLDKYGAAAVKLGFLFGLGACVLVL